MLANTKTGYINKAVKVELLSSKNKERSLTIEQGSTLPP